MWTQFSDNAMEKNPLENGLFNAALFLKLDEI